jgi:hypothetical protein
MNYRVILSRARLPISWSSEISKPDQGKTVARMCGRVTDSEYPTRPPSASYLLGPGRVKKADVRLSGREGEKCSTQNAFISEMPTGNGGGFKFEDSVPGEYWVVVMAGKKKYKGSVSLAKRAVKASHECRDFVFQMSDDEVRVLEMYTAHHLEENAETH